MPGANPSSPALLPSERGEGSKAPSPASDGPGTLWVAVGVSAGACDKASRPEQPRQEVWGEALARWVEVAQDPG
jgi:hypothetical protein